MKGLRANVAALGRAPRLKTGELFSTAKHRNTVSKTAELERVRALPRRDWREKWTAERCEEFSRTFRRPGAAGTLRPIQCAALEAMREAGGLFGPIGVGHGKTLVSFLASRVLEAERALLLVPASLAGKTAAEFEVLSGAWDPGAVLPCVRSYEWLSRESGAAFLAEYRPDVIVADECHRLKNPKAAVTNRVKRYLQDHPTTKFVGMSGTITSKSLRDFAHLLTWALGQAGAPLPAEWYELTMWALAVDAGVPDENRARPGALALLGDGVTSPEDTDGARKVVRRRILETPGVVGSHEERPLPALNLYFSPVQHCAPVVRGLLLRLESTWEIPSPWGVMPLSEPVAKWRAARQIAQGFLYTWTEEPPREWLEARKAWSRVCREVIRIGARVGVDTELLATNAVAAGKWEHLAFEDGKPQDVLAAWQAVRGTYEPVTKATWFDRGAVEHVRALVEEHGPALVWVDTQAMGVALSEELGAPYFHADGKADGVALESVDPAKGSVVVSIASNSEGRNLQAWRTNVVASPPASGKTWEQLLGRTHREGQTADEVAAHVVLASREDVSAVEKATSEAHYISSGVLAQRLLYATRTSTPTPPTIRFGR